MWEGRSLDGERKEGRSSLARVQTAHCLSALNEVSAKVDRTAHHTSLQQVCDGCSRDRGSNDDSQPRV